ncbi:hypothetical protein [Curtobacterium sp. P97]|uniref:hypothetical protein n=1 Tax=Curtobacterium sp. P97 TaxID=2939562 RepID=UPI001B79B023|nr:hypothetical protein [Curtobacterium sp. P97]MBP1301122.1 hypothetical protein [Curtobacterium sp. 1310]MCM3522124.1 hypothetical protein [Curtobacterium sp. P97]
MGHSDDDRPWGDDAFEHPRKRGWFATAVSIVTRSVTAVGAARNGGQSPRQLPLDPPPGRYDHRP